MATQRNFTPEEVQKKMLALPDEVAELLYSTEMVTAVQHVGEKNKLHYDQMGTLERETANVLLGFTETADYAKILATTLSIDLPHAEAVAGDMNDQLFSKIRDAMKTPLTHLDEKSVVMPSASKPAAVDTLVTKPTTPIVTTPVKPAGMPTMPHVDSMLT